jgi:hypothetical protein
MAAEGARLGPAPQVRREEGTAGQDLPGDLVPQAGSWPLWLRRAVGSPEAMMTAYCTSTASKDFVLAPAHLPTSPPYTISGNM